MTKFEQVREMLLQQLEMNKESICNPNVEQMTIIMKFRPHDGPPRSAQLSCLHVYDGPPNTAPNGTSIPARTR